MAPRFMHSFVDLHHGERALYLTLTDATPGVMTPKGTVAYARIYDPHGHHLQYNLSLPMATGSWRWLSDPTTHT
jgi:hypothetical protein